MQLCNMSPIWHLTVNCLCISSSHSLLPTGRSYQCEVLRVHGQVFTIIISVSKPVLSLLWLLQLHNQPTRKLTPRMEGLSLQTCFMIQTLSPYPEKTFFVHTMNFFNWKVCQQLFFVRQREVWKELKKFFTFSPHTHCSGKTWLVNPLQKPQRQQSQPNNNGEPEVLHASTTVPL